MHSIDLMKTEPIPAQYTQYAHDVVNGKIIACENVKLACSRFLSWFERNDIYFDWRAGRRVQRFISLFHHWSDNHNGKPFKLLDFQQFIVYNIFCWKWVKDDTRVINKVYFQVARKNGKTQLASAIQAYMLIGEKQGDSQVYTIANSTAQAALAFNMAKTMVKQLDPIGKHFKFYRDSVKYPTTNSLLRVLSSDYNRLDGLSPYSAVVDEYHAATTNEAFSILRTGQACRTNSLIMVITTAGFNLEGPCKAMRDSCLSILRGEVEDDTQFSVIYELDADDDYRNEDVWIKANPSLGHIVRPEFLREQVSEAQRNTTLETSVKTKNFDMWVQSSEVWLSTDVVNNAQTELPGDFFADKTVYMGLDLSSVSDLTALSVMATDGEQYYFKNYYYLPADSVNDSPNRELYAHWAKKGYLTLTDGNVVDYDFIVNDVERIAGTCDFLQCVGYDKWNSTFIISKLEADGFLCTPVSQSIGALNYPTKELTRLMLSGKIHFDHNPITRWCFANCTIKSDHNDNIKPVKGGGANGKIDGIIAMIMALTTCIGQPQQTNEIFTLGY